MSIVTQLQGWIALILGIAAFALEVYALFDAVRRRPDAFAAADKRTKGFWLAILGVAAAVGFVTLASVGNMLGLIAVVAAGVYLADVKPALDRVMGKGSRRNDGPYGPW
jgi:4-amino-4-deoxy-L-arabinose transferase-like glycosyltransferase